MLTDILFFSTAATTQLDNLQYHMPGPYGCYSSSTSTSASPSRSVAIMASSGYTRDGVCGSCHKAARIGRRSPWAGRAHFSNSGYTSPLGIFIPIACIIYGNKDFEVMPRSTQSSMLSHYRAVRRLAFLETGPDHRGVHQGRRQEPRGWIRPKRDATTRRLSCRFTDPRWNKDLPLRR